MQFKQGGRAELHDVTITLYGRDSARFDHIYGADFEYDPQSGDVIGKGQVQMDLEADPEGLTHPDQAPPKELKNPVHLTTTNLLFNQKTGNASTREKETSVFPRPTGRRSGSAMWPTQRYLHCSRRLRSNSTVHACDPDGRERYDQQIRA